MERCGIKINPGQLQRIVSESAKIEAPDPQIKPKGEFWDDVYSLMDKVVKKMNNMSAEWEASNYTNGYHNDLERYKALEKAYIALKGLIEHL